MSDREFSPLSVTKEGVVPQLEHVAKTVDNDKRKLVKAGDFAINSRSDRRGSAGIASRDGSVSVITIVGTPRDINPKYLHFLLRSVAFQDEFYRYGSGIVADLWSTRWSAMKSIPIPVPPKTEQSDVVAYLDRETAEIDEFIADQEGLIALIDERRRAEIDSAVLGDRSNLVQVRRLRARMQSGTSVNGESGPASYGQIGVLRTGSASKGYLDTTENKRVVPHDIARVTCPLRVGTLLVNRANTADLVATAVYVDRSVPGLYLSDKLWQIEFEDASTEFMAWWAQTSDYRAQVRLRCVGSSTTMQNLSYENYLNLEVPKYSLERQRRLAQALSGEVTRLQAAIGDAREAIALSKERRAALISAAVTGQIDVTERKRVLV